ncbi:hypothetical protein Tco_0180637 [Tanacetum coccineum]
MPAAKASKSQQPKPAHAKPREKKRKLVTETSEAPSPAKRSKAGKVTTKRQPKSSLQLIDEFVDEGVPDKEPLYGDEEADTERAIEESLKEVHGAHRGPLPHVVFREPDSGKFQPFPEIQGKGKEKVGVEQAAQMESDEEVLPVIQSGAQDEGQARPNPVHKAVHAGPNLEHMDSEVTDTLIQQNPEQMDEEFITTAYPNVQENLKLPTEDQVRLEEPASSAGTLSSLRNLDKELIFADQFLMEKS